MGKFGHSYSSKIPFQLVRDFWNFGDGCICDNAYMLLCWNIMFLFQDACGAVAIYVGDPFKSGLIVHPMCSNKSY